MKLTQKRLMITVVMMALAMTGLTAVQVQLLRNAWQLKEQAFDRNVTAALSLTVQQMEMGVVYDNALTVISSDALADTMGPNVLFKQIRIAQLDTFIFEDSLRDTMGVRERNVHVFYADDRHKMIQRVVDDLMVLEPSPITERTSAADIDSLLKANLTALGIGTEPHFAVMISDGDSLVMSNVQQFQPAAGKSSYRTRLFPMDFMPPSYNLVLKFPGRTEFLFNQIWPLALASVVFMIVVAISFWLNLRIISRQQRASASMVDFVNNMTHEFKTPISTVNLASEAIAGDEFSNCPESLQRYNRMIGEETKRMSRHTEQILQFAYLEDGDFVLDDAEVAMHEVISDSCAAFGLAIKTRDGHLNTELKAESDRVPGDASHLANIVTNLVDNAIKYSPGKPEVSVTTSIKPGWFVMEVTDNGLGISRQDQGHIFERYFRCSTGDRHDVKGFGLGLSYVKLLVDAHQGRIELDSQTGQGTTIRIILPVRTSEASRG